MQETHSHSGLWVPVSELARLKNVDKAAISRRVSRLEAQGHLATRSGERGTKLVNVAEFDRAAGETLDAVRALNGGAQSATPPLNPGDPILAKEQARRAAYDADLKQLDLEERLGKLLRIDDVRQAMAECGEAMVRGIDQLPSRADDLASAVAKEGAAGARRLMKDLARELRATLARTLTLASAEPGADEAA